MNETLKSLKSLANAYAVGIWLDNIFKVAGIGFLAYAFYYLITLMQNEFWWI